MRRGLRARVLGVLLVITMIVVMVPVNSASACVPSVSSWITYTDANLCNFWDPNVQVGSMRLVTKKGGVRSSNPGGVFYWVDVWMPEAGDVRLDVRDVAPAGYFGLHGGNPIHVYVNGVDVYTGSAEPQTVHVDGPSWVVMRVHYKYVSEVYNPGIYTFGADVNYYYPTSAALTVF